MKQMMGTGLRRPRGKAIIGCTNGVCAAVNLLGNRLRGAEVGWPRP